LIVLDTHTWVWWAAQSDKLPKSARGCIEEADEIGVSAISCWEVAMLVSKNRLNFDRDVLLWMRQALALPRVELLPISPEIATAATTLTGFHGDPADRLIVSTALACEAPLVTRDRLIRSWPGVMTHW
jgi:PIN domain nuclease of toxin-antitoxin system